MPRFAVRYLAQGRLREAVVEASRADAVAATLGVREPDVITLRSCDTPAAAASGRLRRSRFPLRLFCQELALLLDSGITLYDGIVMLRDKEQSAEVAGVLDAVGTALAQGQSLAAALAMQAQVFPALFIATVQASQDAGQIPDALRRHAEHLAWLDGLRQKLVSAAIYPAILIVGGCLVMAFLTVFVIPRFAQIYDDLGGELPWMTQWLLRLGQGVADHPILAATTAAATAFGLVFASRTEGVRRRVGRSLWHIPHLGPRIRLLQLTALYRTLGLLLEAGVPMIQALEACQGMGGPQLKPSIASATQAVRQGERLSDALQAAHLVTPVSHRMLRVGEGTGALGAMLERAALFHDQEVAQFAEWITKVVNPALMIFMGLLVGSVVVLMYLPIFQVAEQIQ